MIMFCLPYAGGSEGTYYNWKKYLNSSIQIEPIELKGRGKRFDESFYETLDEAVEDIFENIKDKVIENDYVIYGHSMGSLLAYELYYKIKSQNIKNPEHIFFSGYKAPNIKRGRKIIHKLPDKEFVKEIFDLGGTPEELLNDNELLQIFIPILRNDFRIIENYIYKKKKDKIQCDISILNGEQDDITFEEILKWKDHGGRGVKIYNFEGNHFFINNNIEKITKVIYETIKLSKTSQASY
ncbi:thioesterase II family protein [Lysinibacillus xylanilyticus]|uniref:thioesterase II family protein n=1 Tax=Lysinibacillus xylanilyticus TaxID=582475 RepID=UPI0037F161CB